LFNSRLRPRGNLAAQRIFQTILHLTRFQQAPHSNRILPGDWPRRAVACIIPVMRRRFFVERFEQGRASLQGDAAEHLGRVLRAQVGQQYELSDGQEVWLGEIEAASKSAVRFRLLESLPVRPPKLRSALLLSVVKFDRFEWCLEKATELGVAEIIPVAANRSERGLIAAAAKRAERWRKILLESSQQSRRLAIPALLPITDFAQAVPHGPADAIRMLLSERGTARPMRAHLETNPGRTAVVLAIGPEGGWTEPEFTAFAQGGFCEASLGQLILRTETAVIAALAAINYALGEDS